MAIQFKRTVGTYLNEKQHDSYVFWYDEVRVLCGPVLALRTHTKYNNQHMTVIPWYMAMRSSKSRLDKLWIGQPSSPTKVSQLLKPTANLRKPFQSEYAQPCNGTHTIIMQYGGTRRAPQEARERDGRNSSKKKKNTGKWRVKFLHGRPPANNQWKEAYLRPVDAPRGIFCTPQVLWHSLFPVATCTRRI